MWLAESIRFHFHKKKREKKRKYDHLISWCDVGTKSYKEFASQLRGICTHLAVDPLPIVPFHIENRFLWISCEFQFVVTSPAHFSMDSVALTLPNAPCNEIQSTKHQSTHGWFSAFDLLCYSFHSSWFGFICFDVNEMIVMRLCFSLLFVFYTLNHLTHIHSLYSEWINSGGR